MKRLIKILLQKIMIKRIELDDPIMSELIGGRITRRGVLLALKEGKQ